MAQLYRSRELESTVRRWCSERLGAWALPHSRDVLETSLGETHLTWAGAGRHTCLYLPGTNFNAATSTALLTILAGHCQVVCADLPGQPGLSSAERPEDETRAYAGWVTEVLAAVAPRAPGPPTGRTVLVGHSRGAAVALSAPPAAVDSLILLSPAGLAKVRLTATLLARTLPWLLRPTDTRSAALVALMSGEPDAAHPQVVEWMTLVARATRTTGAPGPLPAATLARWRGKRVRVLTGAGDVFFPPSTLQGPVRRHLGIDVDVVPGAGHLLVDQRPDAAGDRLAEELARDEPT